MIIYILKFSACLAIFLAFYKLFLEQENMHQFKRFYLLGSIVTSIAIPFITFTTYVEPQPIVDGFNSIIPLSSDLVSETAENPTNYLPIILWSIYGIGLSLFGLKFGFNLSQIILKIKKNPNLKDSIYINVLLQDLVSPHTFFSYIFLNKYKYETHQIPEEVLLHEQTHAKQKHSLDILLIEILQVIFWFNPLIHVIKNAIKLNHEFLADKAVLNKGVETSNYQKVLLAFSTNDNNIQLANAINYSSIKKRITVMKTQTSKQKIWLRSIVLLPLLALTLYSFSDRIEIIEEKNQLELLEKSRDEIPFEISSQAISQEQDGASREQMKEYEKLAKHYNSLPKDQLIIKKVDLDRMKYIYHLMSDKQKKDTEPFPMLPPPPPPPAPKAKDVKQVLSPPPPPPIPASATKEQKEKYKKVVEEYNRKYTVENGKISENPPPPPPPIPDNATPEQRKKYEEAARIYNLRVDKMAYQEARLAKIKTEKGELTRMRELSKEEVAKLKKDKEAYKNRQKLELTEIRDVKSAHTEKLKKEKLAYKEAQRAKLSNEERLARVREIETPKPPRSPLDHVVDMAKKDAKFYLEGKEISSDEAIKALKENKHLNIQTLDSSSKQPKVYISKNPIIIEN
jgi:bla regulator protein blaR1